MNDSLKPLMFTVGLVDRLSGPAGKAVKSFSGLIGQAKAGFDDIRSGATGLAATGFLLYQGLSPAIEFGRALAEVSSIGVQQQALKKLGDTALELAARYGVSSVEIVAAGSAISKSIKGLNATELSSFSKAAAILSKSTHTNMELSTRYVHQMYERFKGVARSMGKSQWVDQLVSRTQYLSSELGTTSEDIADAMKGLNNLPTGLGVGMSEQLAILATLNKSTGISDAEMQYTAFLERAVEAQGKLGMSFTDANTGKLLPVLQILDKLKARFGDMGGAESWAILDEAFGDGSKLIQQLSKDTAGLGKTIKELRAIKGLDRAADAADKMTGPWAKLSGSLNAIKTAFGKTLLPMIEPAVQWLVDINSNIVKAIRLFPNITRVIGVPLLAVLGLTAAMAALTIISGIATAAMAGWEMLTKRQLVTTWALTAAQWLFNAAFVASPIGWIVLGFVALGVALYAVWQGIKLLWAAFSETTAGKFLIGLIDELVSWFKSFGGIIDWVIDKLNMIPGVNIGVDQSIQSGELSYRKEGSNSEVPSGGITHQISRSIADNSSRNTTVNIKTTEPISPQYVQDQIWQAAP